MRPIILMVLFSLWPGLALAEPCWWSDADHGQLGFVGQIEGRAFDGRFTAFAVSVCLDEADKLASARIRVEVDTASADSGNPDRDRMMSGSSFFASRDFPTAVWQTESLRPDGEGFLAFGELELRGIRVEQPVELRFDFSSEVPRLSGEARVSRLAYEVGTGEFADPDFIADTVDVHFELDLREQR
ncbi:YceI family protein [Wenzhouxiangella marina]|uniref:Uncharacterized protein n=1 Tax=Wenzhouxiangella marina TaxID=1579979 RepID=A0A0K0XUW2_9GAMM|nr:YceI family protein [Wenzhouxiangella marina]AKS41412.1 hypothetical protein WM2015_1035 [Wenzhouxiangella marina]MBB6086834.1 polyisoprenoid-binding protein YceI [Wenzhouxiangella marina]